MEHFYAYMTPWALPNQPINCSVDLVSDEIATVALELPSLLSLSKLWNYPENRVDVQETTYLFTIKECNFEKHLALDFIAGKPEKESADLRVVVKGFDAAGRLVESFSLETRILRPTLDLKLKKVRETGGRGHLLFELSGKEPLWTRLEFMFDLFDSDGNPLPVTSRKMSAEKELELLSECPADVLPSNFLGNFTFPKGKPVRLQVTVKYKDIKNNEYFTPTREIVIGEEEKHIIEKPRYHVPPSLPILAVS